MQIRPILSTLRHHKFTATLLTLQVAFTCAIVCNVAFMIAGRVQRIHVPTGIAENELTIVHSAGIDENGNPAARHAADLAALRAIPGVRSAVAISYSLPLNRNDSSHGLCPDRAALERAMQQRSADGTGCQQPSVYDGTIGLRDTLGVRLVAGRDFRPDEYVDGDTRPAVALITQSLASHLFPGASALGKELYLGDGTIRVIGITSDILRPDLRSPGVDYDSMIWPQRPTANSVRYVMRSSPQDRQRVLQEAAATLLKIDPNRLLAPARMQTYSQVRASFFQRDTTMIGLLLASALGLAFVTALGITGLANFWVQQRRRSIGIRRAIGATRRDIRRYFQLENLLIVSGGIALGVGLAAVLNALLMQHYELPRLPWPYLPAGALVLWTLGQLAVLGPAMRAAAVPPLVATRAG